jgi:uncharacterized protein (TIGR02001 family)
MRRGPLDHGARRVVARSRATRARPALARASSASRACVLAARVKVAHPFAKLSCSTAWHGTCEKGPTGPFSPLPPSGESKMKRSVLVLVTALVASLLPTLAQADDSPLSFNVGAVSDYRYRGISQSRLGPALQGGADYAQGPFYAGTWLSTIQWVKDAGRIVGADSGNAPAEWDLYGGFKGEIAKDASYDVGVLGYIYLGENFGNIGLPSPNTGEVYGALTFGPVTGKVSVSVTDLFGVPDSKGSAYFDLSANFDLGNGFSVVPHVGYQDVANADSLSYTDYSLTLAKDFGKGLSATLAVIGTDADKSLYVTSGGQSTADTAVVVGVKYTF